MDIFLLILLILCIAIGFFQGMIRVIIAIVSFYLSLVLASLYYQAVGDFFVRRFGSARFAADYSAFGIVLLVSFFVLLAAGAYTFRYARIPGRLQYLDRIIGTLLGLALGGLVVGLFSILIYNLMVGRGGCNLGFPLSNVICSATRGSFLVRYFGVTIVREAYTALDPVLPEGAQLIFLVQGT
jgi:membrane protein required for colicin V production